MKSTTRSANAKKFPPAIEGLFGLRLRKSLVMLIRDKLILDPEWGQAITLRLSDADIGAARVLHPTSEEPGCLPRIALVHCYSLPFSTRSAGGVTST